MFGIQLENTADAGGGQNVGWQDNNDWMDYAVNLASAGTYTANFRVATMFSGAQFQIRKSDGTVLGTVTVPNTGNFQSWQTVSTTITLPAGAQTLRLFTTLANGGWNINWWELVLGGTPPPPVNQPPVANAGTAQTITLPTSTVQLNGTGTDSDGTITGYLWTQVSGPSTATITSASTASTAVNSLVQGSYTFRLKVTDNQNATATSDVIITVNPAVTPPPPSTTIRIEAENYSAMFGIQIENTSDAGGGKNVGWQDNNDWMDYAVNLATAGSYKVSFRVASMFTGAQFQLRSSTGTVLATLTVPNTGNFQSWQTISTNVTLPAGLQTLRVYTTLANGGWNINWLEFAPNTTPANVPPVANAGTPQTITLPVASVTLTGSGTDSDGSITGYLWTQVSGPSTATLSNATSAVATASALVAGSYVFRLRVTDNSNATATSDVTITVNAALPPVITRIQAENYSNMLGISVQNTTDSGGGQNVTGQSNNDWMDYTVTLPVAGTYTVRFRVATPNTNVEFRVYNQAGSLLKIMAVPTTGGNQVWTTISTTMALPAGQQVLRIVTTRASGGWNFNWWEFEAPAAGGITMARREITETENTSNGTVALFPNPVTEGFQLQLNNNLTGKVQVRIVNASGMVVKMFNLNKSQAGLSREYVSVSGLGRGAYTVTVSMNGWNEMTRMIKQ